MTVYALFLIDDIQHEGYKNYTNGFLDIWTKYDGELLGFSDKPQPVEGEWPSTRTVILSFPSQEGFNAWYHSAEYQALKEFREAASSSRAILIEGFEGRRQAEP